MSATAKREEFPQGYVARIVVKRTNEAAELWYFGSAYGQRGKMLAERIPFSMLKRNGTPESALLGLEQNVAARHARHWGVRVEREGW